MDAVYTVLSEEPVIFNRFDARLKGPKYSYWGVALTIYQAVHTDWSHSSFKM